MIMVNGYILNHDRSVIKTNCSLFVYRSSLIWRRKKYKSHLPYTNDDDLTGIHISPNLNHCSSKNINMI